MATGKRRQAGYTYLLVLFAVAALGLVAAEAGVVWKTAVRREREAELLVIGVDIARALARYRDASPLGTQPWPSTLEELVEDRRFPVPRRHLRRIYRDPFTGRAEWGLVRQGEAIVGIFSQAEGVPLRRAGLPAELGSAAKEAASYADWVFRPRAAGDAAASPLPPPYEADLPYSNLQPAPR
jgi:type II secretory pathway pseudopilin PulG